ncbi:PilW family protein [Amphritea sp.]|uniref:PilW family protein n=1 Tax=Amphritea sp. TaxID=1872502 RepID=UPI003D141A12
MKPLCYPRNSQSGFSLVELMIASVIGLLLTSAMLAAYVASARTYQIQDAMSEVQESGRFAMRILLKDLRQSGVDVSGSQIVLGVKNSTDSINDFETSRSDLIIADKSVLSDIVYLPGLDPDGPSGPKGDDGVAYYIGSTEGLRSSLYHNKDALVEGVVGLVIEYGVDSDGDKLVDSYKKLTAMNATDWDEVMSVRFYLLMSSSGTGVTEQAQQLIAPFNTVDTSDRRLYQVFTATALLRNALVVSEGG